MPALLDVNALIALVDIDHVDHAAMQRWFTRHQRFGWATCPLTENGMVRVLSQAAYPSGQRTPVEVIQILAALKGAFSGSHQFWPDEVSLTDDSLFDGALLVGARQVTDVYLLGLTARRKGTLVSFDRRLAWQAVMKGSKELICHPGERS
jgi:toxin-antitoxin system PIN domain toxin